MVGRQRDRDPGHAGDLVLLVAARLHHRHTGGGDGVGRLARAGDGDGGFRLDRHRVLADVGARHPDGIARQRGGAAHGVVAADVQLVAGDLRAAADVDGGLAAHFHVDLALAARHQRNRAGVHLDVHRLHLAGRDAEHRAFHAGVVADLHARIQVGRQRRGVDRHRHAAHFQRTRLGQQAGFAVAFRGGAHRDAHDGALHRRIVHGRLERAAQARFGAHHAHADDPARDRLGIGAAEVATLRIDVDHAGRDAQPGRRHRHALPC
ncbi:hypothetical protein G6F23_012934 [Rhizopus arrhizus]|nr:hypothetical protein G6F23_012934 [Rhizopus arrhizus]